MAMAINNPIKATLIHSLTETATVHVLGQHSRWRQIDTACCLISAPQCHHIPCSGHHEFTVSKMLPMKADLHGYLCIALSLVCLDSASVAFMLSYYLDLSSCIIMSDFSKSRYILHNYDVNFQHKVHSHLRPLEFLI